MGGPKTTYRGAADHLFFNPVKEHLVNPKRWRWYTWFSLIYFILSLITFYRITGLRGGVAEVLEVTIVPGLFWLVWFLIYKASALNDRYYNRRKAAAAQQQEPTPQ